MSAFRRAWAPVALLAVGALLHLRQLLGEQLFWRDSHQFFAPAKFHLAATLQAGELPQWWPYDAAGTPFLAQPMFSTFHPTTLLYLILPFWKAFPAQDVAATLLALSGTWLLGRALKLPREAAFVAAVLFAANGYVVGLSEHTFMKLSAGTMPWYLWALLVARRGRGWIVAPSAAMGLLLLAGDPQVALLAAFAGLVLAVAQRRGVVLAIVSPIVGGLLAAIQLWPSLLMLPETERGRAMTDLNNWALEPRHLAELAWPVTRTAYEFAPSTFFGLAGIALALFGLVRVRGRALPIAFWIIALVAVWLSLGDAWGLNALARLVVPMWGKLRYPIKSMVLAMLALSVLAGYGVAALRRKASNPWFPRVKGAILLVAAILFVVVRPDAAVVAAGLVSLVLAILLLTNARPALRVAGALAAIAPLLFFTTRLLPTVPTSFYDASPIAQRLAAEGVGLLGPAFDRLEARPRAPAQIPPANLAAGGGGATGIGALYGLPALTVYMPGASTRVRDFFAGDLPARTAERLFGALGVGYLVLGEGVPGFEEDPELMRDDRFGFTLRKLRRVLPRAYGVHRARAVADSVAAAAQLRLPEFKPGREILVERAEPEALWSSRPDAPAQPFQIVSRTNASLTLEGALPWPGFVVLNEAWFPGWSASVDGTPAPVLIANAMVRAVEVGAGRHRIELRYETPGLWLGALLSAVAWTLLLLGAWALARGRVTAATAPAPRSPDRSRPRARTARDRLR